MGFRTLLTKIKFPPAMRSRLGQLSDRFSRSRYERFFSGGLSPRRAFTRLFQNRAVSSTAKPAAETSTLSQDLGKLAITTSQQNVEVLEDNQEEEVEDLDDTAVLLQGPAF